MSSPCFYLSESFQTLPNPSNPPELPQTLPTNPTCKPQSHPSNPSNPELPPHLRSPDAALLERGQGVQGVHWDSTDGTFHLLLGSCVLETSGIEVKHYKIYEGAQDWGICLCLKIWRTVVSTWAWLLEYRCIQWVLSFASTSWWALALPVMIR